MKKFLIRIIHIISVFIAIYCLSYLNYNADEFSLSNINQSSQILYETTNDFNRLFNENLTKIYRYIELKNLFESNGYFNNNKTIISGYKDNNFISFTIEEMSNLAKEIGYSINRNNEVILNKSIFNEISQAEMYLDSAEKDFIIYPFEKGSNFKPFTSEPLVSIIDIAYSTISRIAEYRKLTAELNDEKFGMDFIVHFYLDNKILRYQNHSNVNSNDILRNPYHIILSSRDVENNVTIDDINDATIHNTISLLSPYNGADYIFEIGFNEQNNLENIFTNPIVEENVKADEHFYAFVVTSTILSLIVAIISLLLIVFTTGVVTYAGTRTIHLHPYDNIYFEVQLLIATIIIVLNTHMRNTITQSNISLFQLMIRNQTLNLTAYEFINYITLFAVATSLIRKIKSKNLATNSILYHYFTNLTGMNSNLNSMKAGVYSLVYYIFIISSVLICVSLIYGFIVTRVFLFIILAMCLAASILLSIIYFNMIAKILTANISSGNSMQQIQNDLLLNISHDIKTPLTSIINYSDILLKENNLSETDSHYVDIIHSKSLRLKSMVNDIMEINKIESNSLQLKMEKINFCEIVKQSFAEYSDQFDAKNLEIKYYIDNNNLQIIADGTYLWRIIDNICSNILKYAREKTSVDIYLFKDGTYAKLVVKNKTDIKLDPNVDWTLRFVTADVSRTNGSYGLGLNIASKLAKIQKGVLTVSSDDDYFISELSFRAVK